MHVDDDNELNSCTMLKWFVFHALHVPFIFQNVFRHSR